MYAAPARHPAASGYPQAAMLPSPFHFHHGKAAPMTPFYHAAAVVPQFPLGVPVRQVWAHNFDAEMNALFIFATRARHVALSVQYPGVVHGSDPNPTGPSPSPTLEKRYALLKANVDALKPLQLGLAVLTDDGRCAAWEFNLRGFDASADPHAARSVAHLTARGMDLGAHANHGVPVASLSMKLHHCGLLRRSDISWVTYAGAYHVAYLLKIVTAGQPLPADFNGFLALAKRFLCGDVFDVARIAGDRPGLPVGLERIAAALGLAQPLVSPRLGGARAVLAMQVFVSLGPCFYRGFTPLI